MKIIKP